MKTRAAKPERAPGGDRQDGNLGLQFREAKLEVRAAGEDGGQPTVHMTISSETPVLRWLEYNGEWQRCWEILDHSPVSINLERAQDGLVVLDRHFGDQIGRMAVTLDEAARKLGGPVKFCSGQRARDIEEDARQGLRKETSIGYLVDADSYRLEGEKDGIPVVRGMKWTLYEASFEPIPADISIGVGRKDDSGANINPAGETPPQTRKQETRNMDPKEIARLYARALQHGIGIEDVRKLIDDDAATAAGKLDALIIESQHKTLGEREAQIAEMKKEAEKKNGRKLDFTPPIGGDEKSERKITERYSLMNVVRHFAGENVDIGHEREVTQEIVRQRGKAAQGIIIPFGVLAGREALERAQRSADQVTVTGTAGATVATSLLAYADLLRTRYVLGRLGVQFLPGLVGNVAIPRMTGGATGYWVPETGNITASVPELDQVPGTPHTSGALVNISRTMLLQSTPAAEEMIRNEIIERVTRLMQIAVFNGIGSSGQPKGITRTTGVHTPEVTLDAPTFEEIVGFLADIEDANADADNMRFCMSARVKAKLATTLIGDSGSERILSLRNKDCIGYGIETTRDVGREALFFGAWNTVVVGIWGGGIDVAATDSQLFASGGITLRAMQDVDVMIRYPQALAYNLNVISSAAG